MDPCGRHDLLAVPDSVASVELPDLHHVRRSEPQTVSAQLDAVGVGSPTEAGRDEFGREERIGQCLGEGRAGRDAQRIEEFLPGVVQNRPRTVAVCPFQRSREHRRHQVSTDIGVPESLARFESCRRSSSTLTKLRPGSADSSQTYPPGNWLLNPPDMVISWRKVTLAVSPLMASRCFGSNVASGWSMSAIRPSSIAIPIRIETTLFVTENTCPWSSSVKPCR